MIIRELYDVLNLLADYEKLKDLEKKAKIKNKKATEITPLNNNPKKVNMN